MTDREKLIYVAKLFGLKVIENEKTIVFASRRFFFNEAGEITRVVNYKEKAK